MSSFFLFSTLFSVYLYLFGNYDYNLSEQSFNRFLLSSICVKDQDECRLKCDLNERCRASIFKFKQGKKCFLYSVIPSEKREEALQDFDVYVKDSNYILFLFLIDDLIVK